MKTRAASAILALASAAGLAASPLRAADAPAATPAIKSAGSTMGGNGPIKDELNPQVKQSVKRGLDWLAKAQTAEGGFSGGNSGYGGEQPGIAALAGLAFMADGNMPDEGPYGKNVTKTLDYICKNTQPSGLIAGGQMYGHGFATLFLAEAYGTTQRADVKEKLQLAVRLIVKVQNSEGGWRYNPAPQDADISVTICQIMALRAARNAGIKVPKLTIDRAIDYVKKSQESDGGFAYMLNSRGSAFPRSAAGVACLYYAGVYQGNEVNNGITYLMKHVPGQGENRNDYHFFYGNYYGTQAAYMAGGDAWAKYWPAIRAELIKKQTNDGSWTGEAGTVYATSMALIIMQVPNRLLPILQK